MQRLMVLLVCAALVPVGNGANAQAIRKACQKADRPAASAGLCGCIQNVANRELTRKERRKVAKWFGDPHQAQVTRQSNHWADEQLWERYKRFGDQANKLCSS